MTYYLLVALILPSPAVLEWEIPEELRPPESLVSIIAGFSPVAQYAEELQDDRAMLNWLNWFVDNRIETQGSYTLDERHAQHGFEEGHCSLFMSDGESCYTPRCRKGSNISCLQYWHGKSDNRTEICMTDDTIVDCEELTNGTIEEVTYTNETVTYSVSGNRSLSGRILLRSRLDESDCDVTLEGPSSSSNMFSQGPNGACTMDGESMPLRRRNTTLYCTIPCHLDARHSCASQEAEIRRILPSFVNASLCICGVCSPIYLENGASLNTTDVCLLTSRMIVEVTVDEGVPTPLAWLQKFEPSVTGRCNRVIEKTIRFVQNDRKRIEHRSRYELTRGRFHCPSEVTCPWEAFYAFFSDDHQLGLNLFYVVITMLFLFYFAAVSPSCILCFFTHGVFYNNI